MISIHGPSFVKILDTVKEVQASIPNFDTCEVNHCQFWEKRSREAFSLAFASTAHEARSMDLKTSRLSRALQIRR